MKWPESLFISSAILALAAVYIFTFDKQVKQSDLVIQPPAQCDYSQYEESIRHLQDMLAVKDQQCRGIVEIETKKALTKTQCYFDDETGTYHAFMNKKDSLTYEYLLCSFKENVNKVIPIFGPKKDKGMGLR